jgi:hypothetical protein
MFLTTFTLSPRECSCRAGRCHESTIVTYGSPSSVANETTSKNKTISHSNEPLCWSGSQPDTASIQSGQKRVTTYRSPVIPPTVTCAERRRGNFLIEAFNSRCSGVVKGGPSSDAKKAPRRGVCGGRCAPAEQGCTEAARFLGRWGRRPIPCRPPSVKAKWAGSSCFQPSLDC